MKKVILSILLAVSVFSFAPRASAADFNFPVPSNFFDSPFFKNFKNIKIDGDYKKNKNLVKLEFSNLKSVKKVVYTLIYVRNGIEDGVTDSFTPNGKNTVKKEVFLGTCSSTTCVIHDKVTKITLEVTGEYNDGTTFSKNINIKP